MKCKCHSDNFRGWMVYSHLNKMMFGLDLGWGLFSHHHSSKPLMEVWSYRWIVSWRSDGWEADSAEAPHKCHRNKTVLPAINNTELITCLRTSPLLVGTALMVSIIQISSHYFSCPPLTPKCQMTLRYLELCRLGVNDKYAWPLLPLRLKISGKSGARKKKLFWMLLPSLLWICNND